MLDYAYMKVADVMSTTVDTVTPDTSIKEVCRIIFGRGVNGVPVLKGKKIVGFISERDILSNFHPSIKEYIEDPVHEGDFEAMEEKIGGIFSLPASKVMSKHVTTVSPEAPLMRALSMMLVHKVGRLPVVDKRHHLIGMISKGDVFRASVGDRLPFTADEEYHDWQAKHYDVWTDWNTRLKNEIPDLTSLFNKYKVSDVLDIGFGTGEHDIALAKKGFNVTGIESSRLIYTESLKKLNNLPQSLASKIDFHTGSYEKILNAEKRSYGAAIFMGNALAHLVPHYEKVFSAVSKKLLSKGAVVVLQNINYEKIFKVNNRLLDFTFGNSNTGISSEHLFLNFYDPSRDKRFTLNTAVFDHDGKKWKFRAMNATPIANLNKQNLTTFFKKYGFKKVMFYGGNSLGRLFNEEYNPLEHYYLNVVAVR